MERKQNGMLCHDVLGFRKFNMASSFYMVFEMASSRNCYLFCLVCFSICMNISHKLFIFNLWSISLSSFQFSFGIEHVHCTNIPMEWRPHIIFFLCFCCFYFHLCRHRSIVEFIWAMSMLLLHFFLNRRQAESSLDYIHISRTTLNFFVVFVTVVTCASMMMYVALESFCQFQCQKNVNTIAQCIRVASFWVWDNTSKQLKWREKKNYTTAATAPASDLEKSFSIYENIWLSMSTLRCEQECDLFEN